MTIEDIKNILENEPLIKNIKLEGRMPWKRLNNKRILKILNIKYNNIFSSFSELLYLLKFKNNLENIHIFCECGNKNSFRGMNKGYAEFCSTKCVGKSTFVTNKVKSTNLIKYGNVSPLGNKQIQEKIINTNLRKLGCKYPSQSEKVKEKIKNIMLEKYGTSHFINLEKRKKTCLEKYGVSHFENKEKAKITCLKKYGVDSCFKNKDIRNKIKTTCINKYGADSYSKTEEYKLNRKLNKDFIVNKQKQTMLKKYGVDNYTKTKFYKEYMKNDEVQKIRKIKEYNSKKKNNTFNTSKPEELIFNKLKSKFPDVIHHYTTDSRYPFECDFYIPSKDLFIELHFHWTHGKEPFNENNVNHVKQLNLWKSKTTKFYKIAINVWTNRDVKKLKIANKNNLNYKIFYTYEEFSSWFRLL